MLPLRSRVSGYTLVEIAIVLAVLGVVLGAIWVAASHAIEKRKVARFSEQVQSIVSKVDALVMNNPNAIAFNDSCYCTNSQGVVGPCGWPQFPTSNPTGTVGDFTQAAIDTGLIPQDMITDKTWAGKTVLLTPWGYTQANGFPYSYVTLAYAASFSGAVCDLNANLFTITIGQIPQDACEALLVPNFTNLVGEGLFTVYTWPVNGDNGCKTFYGLTPSNYQTYSLCGQTGITADNLSQLCQYTPNKGIALGFKIPPPGM